jgi:hypothetical protein
MFPSMYDHTLHCFNGHDEVRWQAFKPAERFCWFCGTEGLSFEDKAAWKTYPQLDPLRYNG